MSSERKYQITAVVFSLVVLLLFGAAVYKAVTYQKVVHASISDRFWTYTVYVKYKVTDCSVDADGMLMCDTDTRTRCKSSLSGREFPLIRPERGCAMRGNDFERESVDYYIVYRIEETSEKRTAMLRSQFWDDVDAGNKVRLTLNIFNVVIGVENE